MFSANTKGDGVAGWCYPFLMFGTTFSQVALLFFGLMVSAIVFFNHPNTGFESETAGKSPLPLAVMAIGLLVGSFFDGRKTVKIILGSEVVSARLCKIKPDNSGDSTEYHLTFEYADLDMTNKRFQATRDVDDLVVGQSVDVLLNRQLGLGLLEPNLPGGITFENLYGITPVSKECWFRILVIPLLSLLPLLGLIGSVSAFIQQQAVIGGSFVYGLPMLLQAAWLFKNRRYFSPGKPVPIDCESELPSTRTGPCQ